MTVRSFTAGAGRLDAVAAAALGVPRSEVQRAIAQGRLLVDGRPRPKSFRLSGGERVDADLPSTVAPVPEPGPLAVLREDPYLLVVSKPTGMVTHPTASRRTGTLVNRLLGLRVPLSSIGGPDRPGMVHRLDAGTSGLMIVAKDDETHLALQAMFRRHAVDRRYLALVRGSPAHDEFRIEAALRRRGALVVARASGGRASATSVRVLERLVRTTLVEARPRTGRTHQIRVHLSAAGHPILGDRAYGGGGEDAAMLGLSRPFLHSQRISFAHPRTGEAVDLEEDLPADLAEALERARAG